MSILLELAGRCENLKGPSLDLNEAIYEALGAKRPIYPDMYWTSPDGATKHYDALVPRYTHLIDAAMILIPEGYWTTLDHFCMSDIPGKTKWRTFLNRHFEIGDRDYLQKSLAVALTPALAVCAAALRARGAAVSRPQERAP